MAKSTQHVNPPLLPLEYCRIERAARLLGCEVEDILHWGAESKICIYVMGEAVVFEPADIWLWDSRPLEQLEANPERLGLADAVKPVRFQVSEQTSYLRGEETAIRDAGSSGTIMKGDMFLSGLWRLPISAVRARYLGLTMAEELTLAAVGVGVEDFALVKNIELPADYEVWLTRVELQALESHIRTGSPIPTLNGFLKPVPREFSESAMPKVTATQSRMIKALLQLHPEISNDMISTPHTLFVELEKMFAKASIQCPIKDGKSLSSWLERAG